jgi:GNAT superfamily N-acetyltransferase
VGRRLIEDLIDLARGEGCHRIETDTTNDNTAALRFYQRQSFRIVDCRCGAFAEVLRMKGLREDTQIRGNDDIPIRDVFRLALDL